MDVPEQSSVESRPASERRRILVTGGAGFIGSRVVARLMLMGSQVRVVDNFSTGRIENLADAACGGLTEADVVVGDIRTPEGVEVIHQWRPDVVVHLAAQASVSIAERSPLYDVDVNVFGTVNVLEACVRSQVGLFVNATTSTIFGDVPAGELPIEEDYGMAPAGPYGISKAGAVRYVDWYGRRYGLPCTSMVLSNVYGQRQDDAECGVVSLMVDALLDGRPVTIHDDGGQTRDFVHVDDVAEAVALACHSEGAGLVNIASGRQTTINEVYRAVSDAVGTTGSLVHRELHESTKIRNMALDIGKARALLGWQPTIGFTQGVRLMVRDARRRRTSTAAIPPIQGPRVLSGR